MSGNEAEAPDQATGGEKKRDTPEYSATNAIIGALFIIGLIVFFATGGVSRWFGGGAGGAEELITELAETVIEDQYHYQLFEMNRPGRVKVTAEVLNGPPVELIMLTERGWNTWQTVASSGAFTADTVEIVPDLGVGSLATTFESGWVRLDKGTYCVMIDNTDYGQTIPPMNFEVDETEVRLTVIAK
ncbi:MAG: hypothetical protein AAGB26_01025 [Planctomycetota bacterium]